MIETNQLQALVAVARAKSFSKAAEGMGVTQSAISQNIKALESKVGAALLSSGKASDADKRGERLYLMARDFFSRLEDALLDIEEHSHDVRGRIRIGTVAGIGKSWVISRILELAKNYPELRIVVQLDNPQDLLENYRNMKLDAIIAPQYSLPNAGEKLYLGPEKLTLVFPLEMKEFSITSDLTMEQLLTYPVVLFEEDDQLFNLWCRQRFGQVPRKIKKRLVINGHGNILQAVSKGLGVAVVPTHVLNRSFYLGKVGTLGKEAEIHSDDFYLVYHSELRGLERMKVLIDTLMSVRADVVGTEEKN